MGGTGNEQDKSDDRLHDGGVDGLLVFRLLNELWQLFDALVVLISVYIVAYERMMFF